MPSHLRGTPLALACLLVATPAATGKGVELQLRVSDATPSAGEVVRVTLRGIPDPAIAQPCRVMRVIAVAPGVPVRRALSALEGGRASRPAGRWAAFRLASLRRVGEWRWTARLRPGASGRWTLVVPNICADGYVLPAGAARLTLDVRGRPPGVIAP
jgi:hypothetical protein